MMSKIADKVGSSQGLNRLNKNVYMMQKIVDKAALNRFICNYDVPKC